MTNSEMPHLFFFFPVPSLLNCKFETFPSGKYRKVLAYFTTCIILLCIILNGNYRKILIFHYMHHIAMYNSHGEKGILMFVLHL